MGVTKVYLKKYIINSVDKRGQHVSHISKTFTSKSLRYFKT